MADHLQLLRPPQRRTQLTSPLHDILRKLHVDIAAPIVVLSAAAKDYAAAQGPREYVGGFCVIAPGATDIHAL